MPNSARDFLLVGITGGIGSGKSAVADVFRSLGRQTYSADVIARMLMEEDAALRSAIAKKFGDGLYWKDGALNRPALAATVFQNARLRRALERLVHPPTLDEIHRRVAGLTPDQRRPYVIVEAALIYESGFDKDLDRVIVVDADEHMRIERIMKRDNLSAEQVSQRIAAQMRTEEKVRKADFVIRNDGGIGELRDRVLFVDRLLQHMVPDA